MQALLLSLLLAQAGPPDLTQAALQERGSYELARGLTDDVGARQAGSKAAERAVVWAEAAMKRAGLTAVHREPVQVRHWVRGAIAATLRAEPSAAGGMDLSLTALALGGSVATPAAGVEGDVVDVESLEQIAALGERGKGAIVFVNTVMTAANVVGGDAGDLRDLGGHQAARVDQPLHPGRLGEPAHADRSQLDDARHAGPRACGLEIEDDVLGLLERDVEERCDLVPLGERDLVRGAPDQARIGPHHFVDIVDQRVGRHAGGKE